MIHSDSRVSGEADAAGFKTDSVLVEPTKVVEAGDRTAAFTMTITLSANSATPATEVVSLATSFTQAGNQLMVIQAASDGEPIEAQQFDQIIGTGAGKLTG